MRIEVDASDVLAKAKTLSFGSRELMERLDQIGVQRGADAVRFIQRRFRQGGTSASRTAQRTGKLYDAYDSETERVDDGSRRGIDLHVGLIKPGESDEVLLYGRVQEGYDAGGNRVSQFTIVPRTSDWLVFKTADGRWVRTKKVVLRPRPTFPAVEEMLPPYLIEDVQHAFHDVVVQ